MREIQLADTTVLDTLYGFSDWFFGQFDYAALDNQQFVQDDAPYGETATDQYLEQIDSNHHVGFPPAIRGHELTEYSGKQKFNQELVDRVDDVVYGLEKELAVKRNALAVYYPPGGYIGWHTNWNAPGYNVLFSYSLTGDGEFKYYDIEESKIIHMPDKKGVWTAKVGYYGSVDEPEKVCWHAATTNSPRLTFAYLLPDGPMWEMMVDDLENN